MRYPHRYPKQSWLLAFFNELDARAKAAKPDELRAVSSC